MIRIFRGRLSREGFILGHVIILFYLIVVSFIIAKIISSLIYWDINQEIKQWVLYIFISISFILPVILHISLFIRRAQDMNMNTMALLRRGWMIFQHPLWILEPGSPNTNRFGLPANKNPDLAEILGLR